MSSTREYLMRKQAALSPAMKSALTMGAVTAGTTIAAAVGTAQIQAGIESAHNAVSRSIAFKKMLNDNPDLRKKDGRKTRRYFNTMFNMSPELGKDPFASASWVRKMDEYDYADPQSLQTLATTGAKLRERSQARNMQAFQLAQGAVSAGADEFGRVKGHEFDLSKMREEQALKTQMQAAKMKHDDRRDLVKGLFGALGNLDERRYRAKREDAQRADENFRTDLHRHQDQVWEGQRDKIRFQEDRWKAQQSPQALGFNFQDKRDSKQNIIAGSGKAEREKYLDFMDRQERKRALRVPYSPRGQRELDISPAPYPTPRLKYTNPMPQAPKLSLRDRIKGMLGR